MFDLSHLLSFCWVLSLSASLAIYLHERQDLSYVTVVSLLWEIFKTMPTFHLLGLHAADLKLGCSSEGLAVSLPEGEQLLRGWWGNMDSD